MIGTALDILDHCGTPRAVISDIPMGNPLGVPWDQDMHERTLRAALALAASAPAPGARLETGYRWAEDEDWKQNYGRVHGVDPESLLALGEENRRQRRENKANGLYRR